MPDVLVYDNLPEGLRVQVVHIITDVMGARLKIGENDAWRGISKAIAKEHYLCSFPWRPAISETQMITPIAFTTF